MTSSQLYKSAAILGVSSLFSRILGVLRDHLLARYFGAGGEGIYNLDVYYGAFRIPDFVYGLLVMGTVSAAFIPVLTQVMKSAKGNDEHYVNRFISNVLTLLTALTFLVALIGFVFAPQLVAILVPGFDGETSALTVTLTRIMLLSPIFFCVSSVFQAIQNAKNLFLYYALAPLFYNLGIIAGIVFFGREYGVYAVAGGVVIGALLHMLVQLPGVKMAGFTYRFVFDAKDEFIWRMWRLFLPRVVGTSVTQINLIFDTLVASLLPLGSITVLNYAVNLSSLPLGLIGVSFAVASFATLSQIGADTLGAKDPFSKEEKSAQFAAELRKVIRSVCYFLFPMVVGLFVLRYEVVDVILRSGEFSSEAAVKTAGVFGVMLIGVIGQSLLPLFSRAFYALHNTVIPVVVSVSAVVINLGLNFYLGINLGYGVYGIAVASAFSTLLGMIVLMLLLRSKYLNTYAFIPWGHIGIILVSALIMGVSVWFLKQMFFDLLSLNVITKLLALGVSSYLGAILYYLLCRPKVFEESKLLRRLLIGFTK